MRPTSELTMKPKNILAFGEILWDLLPDGPVLGGAPFNLAYRAGTFGHRSLIASRLGRDELGESAFEQAGQLGLDRALIQWHGDKPTGTVPIKLDDKGVPDFTILPDVAYDYIEISESLLREAARADCICFGTLVQRTPVSRETLYRTLEAAPNSLKLADINLRRDCYSPETVRESLNRTDIVKLNDDEVRYVAELLDLQAEPFPEFALRLMERCRLSHCIITLGPRGVFATNAAGEQVYEPGRDVVVKDTTGSGDGLTAAFISSLLEGESLRDSCLKGNAMGSLVAARAGATATVTQEELAAFLAEPPPPIMEPALEHLHESPSDGSVIG